MKMNFKRFFKVRNSRKIKMFSMALICALAVSVGALPTAQAVTRYVDGVTGGNGSSWISAHTTIQEGIDASNPGDEIWVKGGTYLLINQINVNEAVKIYGGFNGTEINKEDRDWATNVTIIDGQDQVHHVLLVTADATIDGFTITRGNAGVVLPPPVGSYLHGGGIHIKSVNATIANCTLTQNYAYSDGGGIFIYESGDTFITNCIFDGNGAYNGAGIFDLRSTVTITNSLFINNESVEDGSGVYNASSDNVTISNCTFSGNVATNGSSHGGGIYNTRSNTTITNSIVWGNSAIFGPQIFNSQPFPEYAAVNLSVDYVALNDRLYLESSGTGSLEYGETIWITDGTNTESAEVDGLFQFYTSLFSEYLTGTTLTVNSTSGIVADDTIWITDGTNTESDVVTGTTATTITVQNGFNNSYMATADVYSIYIDLSTGFEFINSYSMAAYVYTAFPLTVTYSDVQDGNWQDRAPVWENNIDVNPNFVASNDYHIDDDSPCIDAGDNTALPDDLADLDDDLNTAEEVPYDLDGNPRRLDDPATGDTGYPLADAPYVDMGAYEYFLANTVTFVAGTGGIITGNLNQIVAQGYDCTEVTAVSDANYQFFNWTGDYGGTDNPLTITNVTSDMNITATFAIDTYTITVTSPGAGSGGNTDRDGANVVNHGDSITITPNPDTGYHFNGWTGAPAGQENNDPLTIASVTGNMGITANFAINTYTVTVTSPGAGSGGNTDRDGANVVNHGDTLTIDPTADSGYKFTLWSGDASGSDDPLEVTVTGPMTITANFALLGDFTVSFVAGANGSITGTLVQNVTEFGSTTPVEAIPATGYDFTNWTGTGGFTSTDVNPLTVNVTSDMTITASFDPIPYTLTMAIDGTGNGALNPAVGGHIYDYNSIVPITATANATSVFVGWTGVVADSDAETTTVTITGDMTVTATFASDGDSDGISDIEEDGAPNGGDGNNDGTDDSLQNNVTSLLTQDGLDYVTIESAPGTTLNNVEAIDNPSPSDSPSGVEFTHEFFDFTITGLAPGGSTTVTLYLPAGAAPTTYYKYGPTPAYNTDHWYEFDFDGTTGAEINGNVITLHFVDGLRGDDDLDDTNGTIVEPGGPAFASDSSDDGTGGGGGGGSSGGCFIATTSSGLPDITVVPMLPYLALMLLLFVIDKASQGGRKR